MSDAEAVGAAAAVPAGASRPVLVFAVASRQYGLPLGAVREVIRVPVITAIPRGPANVVGVMLAGGAVVTVFDLSRWLGLPASALSELSRVLLVKQPGEVVGVVVDRVVGVRELEMRDDAAASLASGSAETPLLLDPDRLFSSSALDATGSAG